MQTTRDLLAALARRHELHSDYQIAKFLGISRQRVSKYQSGHTTLGAETAIQVARALELPPGYVLACLEAERAKRPAVRQAWKATAQVLAGTTIALVLLATTGLLVGIPAIQQASAATDWNTHYTKIAPPQGALPLP